MVAVVCALVGIAACQSEAPPTPATVNLPIFTVGAALAGRADGSLVDRPIFVGGYWSMAGLAHSCAPPDSPPGDLELYCVDGEYGITELLEPIVIVDRGGSAMPATGPHMTPYFPDDLLGVDELFRTRGPVPIVIVGHFDDAKAALCRPQSVQLCRDRVVVDRIVRLG